MKNNKNSTYATNKGGKISSPKGKISGEPTATKRCGNDLRVKEG